MYLLPLSRIYVPLFALLVGLLLFASCDKDEPTSSPTTYKLTLTPPTKGKVEGDKAIYKKDEITQITATAIEGYAFSHWTGVADGIKTQNPLTLKMTAKLTLAAVFVKIYNLNVVALPNGSVKGQKASYKKDEVATLEASANDGYLFSKWLGDVPAQQTTQNPLKLKMTANTALIAEFVKKGSITYTLTLTKPTNGEVTGNKPTYNPDEITNIAAIALDGYYFNKWTGDVPQAQETQNPLKLEMKANVALAAEFKKQDVSQTHKLTLTAPSNGTVIGSKPTYTRGEMTDILATPSNGYTFSHWTGVPDGNKNANPLRIPVTEDLTLGAVFAKDSKTATYTLHVVALPGGAVSGNSVSYQQGDFANITATPSEGYLFSKWLGGVPSLQTTQNPLKLEMTANTALIAEFVKKTYALTVTAPTHGAVVGNKATYNPDEVTDIAAIPNDGYHFSKWTGDVPKEKETEHPLKLKVTQNLSLAAEFLKNHTLTITTPSGGGTIITSPNKAGYISAETVTFIPKPAAGYAFIRWTGDVPKEKETEYPLTLTMDGDKTVAAVFSDAPIYLDANGVTLRARSFAKAGTTHTYNGKAYTIATDKAMLVQALADGDDMSQYITSKVTDMRELFRGKKTFNQDISAWDVSEVVDMAYIFYEAFLFNQDIGSWDVSKVAKMDRMFTDAKAFNQDISKWNTSSATTMRSMFYGATVFNQDISNWNTGEVTNMQAMFYQATAFNQDVSRWNTSKVTNMISVFAYAKAFNQDLSKWKTGKVTSMESMFYEASAFNQDISTWDVSQVTNMRGMFYKATKFNQDLSNWKTGKVTDMEIMFYDLKDFNQNISGWDVSQVTDMGNMFKNAASFNQDLSGWCVQKIAKRQNGFDTGATSWTDASHKPVWGDASKCTN